MEKLRKFLSKASRVALIAVFMAASLLVAIPAQPALATTVEVRTGASGDDVWVDWDNVAAEWEALPAVALGYAGYYSNTLDKTGNGMRFQGVTVPRDAVITAAYITFTAHDNYALTTVNTRFVGEDVDDAAAFTTIADYQARRGTVVGGANDNYLTTATVDWDGIGAWVLNTTYQSADITTIVQEIVNREGWTSGNDMAIFWDDHDDRSTNTNFTGRSFWSWDGDPAKAPQIHIEYGGTTELADVISLEATNIASTDADLNGYILDLNGGGAVTTRGFQWGTVWGTYPNNVSEAGSFGTGLYTLNAAGLPSGTRIYYRAYATNANGTQYGIPMLYYNTGVAGGGGVYTIDLATTQNANYTGYVAHDYNPVITKEAGESNIKDPAVIIIGNTIYMYFSVHVGGGVYQLQYATSTDGGINFTKQGVALAGTGSGWESYGVGAAVVYDTEVVGSKRYAMLYSGVKVGVVWSGIGYAYSSNGISWTRGSSNPVIPLGSAGQWDDVMIWGTSTIAKVGNTYYMHYGGKDDPGTVFWATGLVTWTDFEGTYTKSASNPIISRQSTRYALLTGALNVGTATVTVADTSLFAVDMPVWINNDQSANNDEFNRIISIDSATQMTLEENAERTYGVGTSNIRSWAYGAVTPQSTLVYNPTTGIWTLLNCAFLPYADAGTRESSGYMTSEDGINWTYDYTNSPPIPLDWNNNVISAENPRVLLDGQVSQFTTTTSTNPTVTTSSAINIGTSTATLQGDLSSLGGYTPVYVYFQYGLTTAYGSTTVEQSKTAIGGFTQDITGLTSNTLYHYRAVVRYGGTNYAYGTDYTFTTSSGLSPSPPTNFKVASATATSLTLTWTKGGGATNTVIRVSTSNYPTSVTEGDSVYSGTGTTTTPAGLTTGTRYYYSAWSESGGVYSTTYATTSGIPTADALPVPDTLDIETVSIYKNYIGSGDQLLVYSAKILWDDGLPSTYNAADFFYIQVLDGSTVIKQDRIKQWGYVPGSLYISASTALTWNKSYTFKIIGTSKFSTPPEDSYTIEAANYVGEDYNLLATWVLDLATRMQNSVYWDTLIEFSQTQVILNSQGSLVFETAIPGLSTKCPQLFYPTPKAPIYSQPTLPMSEEERLIQQQEESHGTIIWGGIENIATMFGVEEQTASMWLWIGFYVIAIGLLVVKGSTAGQGVIFAYPVLILGALFGGLAMSVLIAIGAIMFIYFVVTKFIFSSG